MVKIGVIFMPFSNPTCHIRGTADFTSRKVHTVHTVKLAVPLKWQVGFENGIEMTPIFTIIFSSEMLFDSALYHWNILF